MATKTRSKPVPAPAEHESLTPYRDLSTINGSSQVVQLTVEGYLRKLNLWNGESVSDLESDTAAKFQRGVLDINTNKIKQQMFHDLLIGATLPPLIVYSDGDSWEIVDGLQRTSVIVEALKTIIIEEVGSEKEKIKKFASVKLKEMDDNGETRLTSDEFLARPLVVQCWTDLEPDELTKLFMILNRSQQRVSDRHLLEVTRAELYETFVNWGLPVTSQRSEKEHPGHKGRRSKAEIAAHPELVKPHAYKFEYLINGAIAYATQDQHTKTIKTLHEDDTVFNQNLDIIRSDRCEYDFKWVCGDLNKIMLAKYGKSKDNILLSEVFFIPLMAVLGWARTDTMAMSLVESRQSELIGLLNKSETADPMVLEDTARGLNNIAISMEVSVGKKKRNMIYHSWKQYFIYGALDKSYPVNWLEGKKSS